MGLQQRRREGCASAAAPGTSAPLPSLAPLDGLCCAPCKQSRSSCLRGFLACCLGDFASISYKTFKYTAGRGLMKHGIPLNGRKDFFPRVNFKLRKSIGTILLWTKCDFSKYSATAISSEQAHGPQASRQRSPAGVEDEIHGATCCYNSHLTFLLRSIPC